MTQESRPVYEHGSIEGAISLSHLAPRIDDGVKATAVVTRASVLWNGAVKHNNDCSRRDGSKREKTLSALPH
jgi:hypothetical protein